MQNGVLGSGEWQRWVTDTLAEVKTAVDRLPTREELAAADNSKVDRASYTIAHTVHEQAITQQAQSISTVQLAVSRTNEYVREEMAKAQAVHQELRDMARENRRDIDSLQRSPASQRTAYSFYLSIAAFIVSVLFLLVTLASHLAFHP